MNHLISVRPPGEVTQDSYTAINQELKRAGLKPSQIVKGITQPDGSTVFNVFLKGSDSR